MSANPHANETPRHRDATVTVQTLCDVTCTHCGIVATSVPQARADELADNHRQLHNP